MSSSHSSPNLSTSVSFWSLFLTPRQLSQASPKSSSSTFLWSTLGTSTQLSCNILISVSSATPAKKRGCAWQRQHVQTCMLRIPSPSASSSQASPIPSPSASSWPELGTVRQLSLESKLGAELWSNDYLIVLLPGICVHSVLAVKLEPLQKLNNDWSTASRSLN